MKPRDPVETAKRELAEMAVRLKTLYAALEEKTEPVPFGPANLPITEIAVEKIKVGFRRRHEVGDLTSLKKSIAKHGLVNPIIVRGPAKTPKLVCGWRRLEAVRQLGEKKILAVRVPRMTEDEFRSMELAEDCRQNYGPDEVSPERHAFLKRADERAARKKTAVQP